MRKKSKRGKPGPKRKPPPRMVIRRNAAPDEPVETGIRNGARRKRTVAPRQPVGYRVQQMNGSHVAAGVGAGTAANVLGVVAVGKQWLNPKMAAWVLVGAGALASAGGWYYDADHLMAAGAGVAAAGTFSLANQVAIDVYEAAERKAAVKRAERAAAEQAKQLEAARKLIAEHAAQQQRNGPVFRIVDVPDDDESGTEYDEDIDDAA